ncbi:MAG TPA: cytochrome c biogenesis protein CcdA, partial [Patescibacteria group bacterium]|nr:cytochrome c biogenesis protein CcdA [Patescibacteria group bacterium]
MDPHTLLATLPTTPLAALAAAFIAGLLSVATPCVLPMVPITLGTLGVTRATSRGRAVLTAGAYMAGIVLTFTALGVTFALTGRVFGSLLSSPVTAVALAAVFVALALSSFGLIGFRLPTALTQAAAKIGGSGPPGAFAAGLVAGVIAAPCIGPVLAAILSYVSTTRDAVFGAALLAAYGTGFGLPFLVVGAFALRLPKSGRWMDAVKGLFGIALLAGAFWFLRGAFPVLRGAASVPFGAVLAAAGLITFVALASLRSPMRHDRLLKTGSALIAFAGVALLMNAALAPRLRWCEETPAGACLPQTCHGHRITVVVFTAAWCPYCHELENRTLADP